MNAAKRLETTKQNAKTKTNAREEYNNRLQTNERLFWAACQELGLKKVWNDVDFILQTERVRVAVADETIKIMVFSGVPGWSPVQYEIPISLYAPAEVAIATLKATLKAAAK